MTRSHSAGRPSILRRATPGFVAVVLLTACGAPASDEGAPTELPLFRVGEPTLEIGVVEGDPDYTFAAVDDVIRLPDGSLAVSDGGNTRISIYDGTGTFVRSWGARGEGPGEFRQLSRLYPRGTDSLMAADNATATLSVFSLDGEYARQLPGVELSRDSTFRMDSWLYGRFWIDGALDAGSRERVRSVIDRLPPPRERPGYRRVRVTDRGDLWIREPSAANDGRTGSPDDEPVATWTRLDAGGGPVAIVELPSRFELLDAGPDEVRGSWLGPADVSFVRVYALEATDETRPVPSWLLAPTPSPSPATSPDDEEFDETMSQSIRQMAIAQEIHYSSALSYTTDIDAIDFDPPETVGVAFTHADPRGWAAVFTHPTADRLCGLAYGAGSPPGWTAGEILCGPPSAPPVEPGA